MGRTLISLYRERRAMKNITLLSLLTLASTGTSTISWNGKCVRDSGSRLLPTHLRFPYLTPAKCMEACQDQGFLFAGVQIGLECWCGNDAPPEDRIVDMAECDSSCSGDSTQKCGGAWRMNVYIGLLVCFFVFLCVFCCFFLFFGFWELWGLGCLCLSLEV